MRILCIIAATLFACGATLSGSCLQAGTTVIEFDDAPGITNDPIFAFYGTSADTSTSGITVTDGGTPDITLFWEGAGEGWDRHSSTAWTALDSAASVHVAQMDYSQGLSITFSTVGPDTVFHLDQFQLGNASDQIEDPYGWDITLVDRATEQVVATQNSPDLGPGQVTTVVFDYTGQPGANYDLLFEPNDSANFPNFSVFRTALDELTFSQSVASAAEDADFDDSGLVAGEDFLTWQRGNGLTGQTDISNGDANADGTVNADDLTIWRAQYGTGAIPQISVVPEPSTLIILNLSLIGTGLIRVRRDVGQNAATYSFC